MNHITLLDNVLRRGNVLVTSPRTESTPTTATTCTELDEVDVRRLADQLVRLESETNIQIPAELEKRFNEAKTEDELYSAAKAIRVALIGITPTPRDRAREKRAPW